MPSGNCNLQKCPHRPKMANTAYKGCECQVGKGSEGQVTACQMVLTWNIFEGSGTNKAQFTNHMYNHFR